MEFITWTKIENCYETQTAVAHYYIKKIGPEMTRAALTVSSVSMPRAALHKQ